jgi:hypothetical protein
MGMLKNAVCGRRAGLARGVLLDWCRGRLDDDRRPPAIIRAPRQSEDSRALHAPYNPLASVRPSDT